MRGIGVSVRLPSDQEIRTLHEKHSPTSAAFQLVYTHCEIVARADGWLDHTSYLRHGVLGYELLRAEGLPEELCRFCSRHTGVGLSREDVRRQRLPLPPGDYEAETGEEQLVMYADKFHSKTDPPVFLTADTYASAVGRFGPGKEAAFAALRARFGEPDLTTLAAEYGYGVASPG